MSQEPAEDVGIHHGADGAHGVVRAVLDKAQRTVAARIVEARQAVEHAHRPRRRNDVEDHRNTRGGRAGHHDQPCDQVDVGLGAQAVHQQEEQRDGQRQLGEVADRRHRRPAVTQTIGEGEDRQQQEPQHQHADGATDEVTLPPCRDAHDPYQEKRHEGKIEEGRRETDLEGQRRERQQPDHSK